MTVTVAHCSDTIVFPQNTYPTLYQSSYSYDDQDDDDEDNRYGGWSGENKYNYDCPAIPEPSSVCLLAGLVAMLVAASRRGGKAS